MKTRILLLVVAIASIWASSWMLYKGQSELRQKDLRAFHMLRLRDQAFLMVHEGMNAKMTPLMNEKMWALALNPTPDGMELLPLVGTAPASLEAKTLLSYLSESNVNHGSFVVESKDEDQMVVGFSKDSNRYVIVGQSGHNEMDSKILPLEFIRMNLAFSGALILVFLIATLILRLTKKRTTESLAS